MHISEPCGYDFPFWVARPASQRKSRCKLLSAFGVPLLHQTMSNRASFNRRRPNPAVKRTRQRRAAYLYR